MNYLRTVTVPTTPEQACICGFLAGSYSGLCMHPYSGMPHLSLRGTLARIAFPLIIVVDVSDPPQILAPSIKISGKELKVIN